MLVDKEGTATSLGDRPLVVCRAADARVILRGALALRRHAYLLAQCSQPAQASFEGAALAVLLSEGAEVAAVEELPPRWSVL